MTLHQRIHIIGGGGSGKTTLAHRLAERLELPVYELDAPEAELDPLLVEQRWVSEGIFLYGIVPILDRADLIIWLDIARRIAIRRVITRHIRLSLRGKNRHKGLRLLARFAWGQRDYYTASARAPTGPTDWDALTRAATELVLRPYMEKVVHLRSPRAVRTWVRSTLGRDLLQASEPGA